MNDPIELEVFKNLYHSIAEEMGAALRRTAFSPNIKERRDYSCAVFDAQAEVIAMGDHMPVHLGSMPMSVAAAIRQCELNQRESGQGSLEPGDIVMLNDPFCGGTHLPDITLVMPVYVARRHNQKQMRQKQTRVSQVRAPQLGANLGITATRASRQAPDFYVASRAHHADVGGTYPGSMGPCREIYQEGLRIPPVKIMRAGKIVPDVLALLLNNVRTPEEREGDLGAQIAACQTGARRLTELCSRYGLARAHKAAAGLLDYSEQLMRAFLKTVPAGEYHSEDFLDDDGIDSKPIRIAVAIRVACVAETKSSAVETRLAASQPLRTANTKWRTREEEQKSTNPPRTTNDRRPATHLTIDFTGSDPQVEGAVNAVEAITYSACFYVFRCLLREDVPATAGLMRPIRVIAPSGTVVNARPPAAVAGGNVETSQRIVDVLLRALAQAIPDRIPAAAAGTMNNLTIGGLALRGKDLRRKDLPENDRRENNPRAAEPFAYYETIAGGMGARPSKAGVSGVHTHMTNSLNTPAEALESAYPVRLKRYSLRPNSGGRGRHTGGDGIIREIEVLTDAQVTLLADRRSRGPYGLAGGEAGAPGRTIIIRAGKLDFGWRSAFSAAISAQHSSAALAAEGQAMESFPSEEELPGKTSVRLKAGDRIRVESPGGGGWGKIT